eukprot:9471942-Pyramimonas_sp.AAC.2
MARWARLHLQIDSLRTRSRKGKSTLAVLHTPVSVQHSANDTLETSEHYLRLIGRYNLPIDSC